MSCVCHIDRDKRIVEARVRKDWEPTFWNKFVFTDESGCDNSGLEKRLVRRPLGTRYDEQFTYGYPNKTLRVNYFSWVSIHGVGNLTFLKRMC